MQKNSSEVENNLSKSEKSWAETINFLKLFQFTTEELMDEPNEIELSDIKFPIELGKIGDDIVWQSTSPKQIDIIAQEKHNNSIIDKAYEFVNEYCKKHNININELVLQKNNRAITSDIHGDLLSMIVSLIFSGINFCKNCFFYFDLGNNRFITREEAIKLIKENVISMSYHIQFINTFMKYYKQINSIFYEQKNYDKSVKELQQLINQENPNDNFKITKQTIQIEENIGNTIYIRDKNIFKFTCNNENEIIITNVLNDIQCEIQLNIKDENFSKSISANSLATSNLKQKSNEWIKEFIPIKRNSNPIYVIPIPYFIPNLKIKFIDLGDSIDRGPESITCLIIYALLSQAMPNSIICLLGNHETMGYEICESLQNFIEFCIEKKAFRTGYIEKAIKDGQEIYYSYSHVIFAKEDLPNLFALLYIIFNIDTEKKFLREQDIEVFTKHIKEKWPKRFSELPEELQVKVINFFDKNNLKQLAIKFDDPNDPNYIAKSHQFNDFYSFINFFKYSSKYIFILYTILKNAGFKDIDFLELRNAVGDIFYNNYFLILFDCQKFKIYIKIDSGSFMHARRYNEFKLSMLFDNIYQHIGHNPNNFTTIPKNSNGYLINHDVLRSVGHRETESRVNLFILNIYTHNFFMIDGFVSRNGNEISKESQIIIDDSISQIILHEIDNGKSFYTYGELKEHISEIGNYTNTTIDENLIKKSLTINNELEDTKIILDESKGSWQIAINFINQISKSINNSKPIAKDLRLINYTKFIVEFRKNYLNSLIGKIYESAKHTEPNDLKENSYFPLITSLIKQNIITLDKSFLLYFDLKNNEFISEEEYQKTYEIKSAVSLINIFLENFDDFINLCPTPDYNKNFGYLRNFSYEFNPLLTLKSLINKIANKNFDLGVIIELVNKKGKVRFSNDKGNFSIELEPEKIKFSDDNGNYIYIDTSNTKFFGDEGNSISSEKFLCIEINSKTNLNRDYKNSSKIYLDPYLETYKSKYLFRYEDFFLDEKYYNYDHLTCQVINIDSYFQAVKDVVLSWQKDLMDDLIKSQKEAMKFYFEIPIPIKQSKEKFIYFLKEPTNVKEKIENENLFDKEFIEKLIETYDQKNEETITCLMTLALTALSNPNIKFILSNYEATFCGNEYFTKIIDYCIEEKIFINGYVEEVIEDGKQIWHSYFPAIFTKRHLQKLFAILFILIYIDKEIQRLNNCGKELSFYLENYLKTKWPIKLKELPKESQEKLLSFFDEHNLQTLKLNTWEDFLKIDWPDFYEILIKAKFTDIEFFSLKIIVCDIFHNERYSEANNIWKLLFSAIAGKMSWLYHEEYIPQNPNETFISIKQNLNCFNAEWIQPSINKSKTEFNLIQSPDNMSIPQLIPKEQSELSDH